VTRLQQSERRRAGAPRPARASAAAPRPREAVDADVPGRDRGGGPRAARAGVRPRAQAPRRRRRHERAHGAGSEVVAELLRDDLRRVLLGEDVRDGGMLGLSRAAMQDPGLGLRVLGTPLTPTAGLAHATGSGARGAAADRAARRRRRRCSRATRRCASSGAWRDGGGERSAPVLIVAPTGPGFGLGGDGADSPEAVIAAVPGLRVVVLGDAAEAPATCGRRPASTTARRRRCCCCRGRWCCASSTRHEFKDSLGRPLGAARVVRGLGGDGVRDRCGGGSGVRGGRAERARRRDRRGQRAGAARRGGDPRGGDRTGKLVVAHAGGRAYGPGAELVALLADRAILHLDAPVLRVTGEAGPHTGRASSPACRASRRSPRRSPGGHLL
jgi:hypothetical protein